MHTLEDIRLCIKQVEIKAVQFLQSLSILSFKFFSVTGAEVITCHLSQNPQEKTEVEVRCECHRGHKTDTYSQITAQATVSWRMLLPHCQCVAAFPHIYYFQLALLSKLEFICLLICQDVSRPTQNAFWEANFVERDHHETYNSYRHRQLSLKNFILSISHTAIKKMLQKYNWKIFKLIQLPLNYYS
jgi:hypothetical protein